MGMARKPLHQYKAVFFDAGDTLISSPSANAVMHRYFVERSLHCEIGQISSLFTAILREQYYQKKNLEIEVCTPQSDRQFWMQMYASLLEQLGARDLWEEQRILQYCGEMYELFTAPHSYELFADVNQCLQMLDAQGIQLGVVSNFAPTLPAILADKGILDYFKTVIVSTEVGMEKPNPAIFQLALDKAGLDAKDMLYIGDHDLNDVWAPGQVGIDAVKIKRYDYHTGKGISTLLELFE